MHQKLLKYPVLMWLLVLVGALGSEVMASNKDTVVAVVMYGNEVLFPNFKDLPPKEAKHLRDSIASLPSTSAKIIEMMDFYIALGEMNKGDMTNLVDSLFEVESIPYPLVNQLNLFLAHHEFPPDETNQTVLDSALFNPNRYYEEEIISTPFGYKNKSLLDSLVLLQLAGNEILQEYHSPVEKIVMTSPFGWRQGRMHNGVDLDLEVWDPVVAAFPGVVRFAKYYGGYGRVVIVRHYNGLETLYAHLHRFKVKAGDKVNAGDILGLGGSSGRSSGSHLHFETRFKGVALNPRHFIDFQSKELVSNKLQLVKNYKGFVALPEGINFHTVKRGDTLFDIAKYYGTSLKKICELNSIKRNDYLWVGQKLRVI